MNWPSHLSLLGAGVPGTTHHTAFSQGLWLELQALLWVPCKCFTSELHPEPKVYREGTVGAQELPSPPQERGQQKERWHQQEGVVGDSGAGL